VILVGTGEADNSADSYFGLGILRSADGGNTWALIPAGNGGLSFSGLGGTRMAFNTAAGQPATVVAAMAASSEGEVAGALTANTTEASTLPATPDKPGPTTHSSPAEPASNLCDVGRL